MDHELSQLLESHFAERANRAFGDVEAISGRALQPFSFAGEQRATNLLDKAIRALDDGDTDRASALVRRAAHLPFDDHEQAAPAAIAAHMELFCLITDTVEEADVDDSRWLEAAAEVLENADESARYDMRDVLTSIDHDYSLTTKEHSRVRAVVAGIPDRAELKDLTLSPAELADQVMSILAACRAYRAALPSSTD
ncbi:MAG: hypothetical protein L0H25_03870 [Micrococcales bacterium]|nr:hypothetical protein [Micrococcales bacterium]